MIFERWTTVGCLIVAAALAACSGTDGPQQPAMLADNTCAQLRADLNSMDKRGVPGMIDARNNGKKYGAQQDAEISRYNQVLDQYLGGQCASEQRYKTKAGIPEKAPSDRQASTQNASLTTGSLPKAQVKRRKPVNDEDVASAPVEKAAVYEEQAPAKPARRKSTSGEAKSRTAAQPAAGTPASTAAPAAAAAEAPVAAAIPAKAESGLPSAPAPVKAEGGEKKE
jgi:hypothetical protein